MKYHQQDEKSGPIDPNWPKWKYHKDGKSKIVKSKREEDFLGAQWKDSPADHGQVTYPHSDEYMAMASQEPEFDQDHDGEVPATDLAAPKAKRGRPVKTEG